MTVSDDTEPLPTEADIAALLEPEAPRLYIEVEVRVITGDARNVNRILKPGEVLRFDFRAPVRVRLSDLKRFVGNLEAKA